MDLSFTPEQDAFRTEVRAWLEESLPAEIARKTLNGEHVTKAEHVAWQKIQAAKGWLAPTWAAEWGGTGWGPVERFIFDEEAHRAGMPRANLPGIDLLGPILISYGTEEQREHYLPRILSGEDWWCQGFSEPGAGSDLAALSMRAVRKGDHYIVDGTKLWTSHAQNSNMIFCLVRTSTEGPKQAGISFLLIDMEQPGITVSPIITVGGLHHVNQVTIDNVAVPVTNLVGAEGQGWEITRSLLGHERLLGAWIGSSFKFLAQLKDMVRQELSATDHHELRARIARTEIELTALNVTALRVLADEIAGKAPGPEVSVLKLKGSEIQQRFTELLVEVAGPLSLIDPQTVPIGADITLPEEMAFLNQQAMDRRKMSIYGGAREIQLNIIAHRVLRV